MAGILFEQWFHEDFVPSFKKHLKSLNLEEKALLFIGQCSCLQQRLVPND